MNQLYYGDNLHILREHIQDESIDLIYLDPPFNSKSDYNILYKTPNGKQSESQITAFEDSWHWGEEAELTYDEIIQIAPGEVASMIRAFRSFIQENDMMAYLVMMTIRLIELHRVLKDTGSIYLHCDPTASHYLKIVMDAIFGPQCFRREIIWSLETVSGYKSAANNWIRCHDTILFYNKNDSAGIFNKLYLPHKPEYIARFKKTDSKGRKYRDDRSGGRVQYLDESSGRAIGDVWNDIMSFQQAATSSEFLGYPTQKPAALLERIIQASSNEGDVVLDPFCGCGTAIAVAEKMNREWIGIDITHLAINVMKKRLSEAYNIFPGEDYEVIGEPTSLAGAKELAAQDKYQFQWWITSVIGARPYKGKKKGADTGIDAVDYFSYVNPETRQKVTERILISVKGGHISSPHIRDLRGVVERDRAALGFFITLENPTGPMEKEAVTAGFYEYPLTGNKFRKIQILTVEEILQGKKFDVPGERIEHTKKAEEAKQNQKELKFK